MKGDDVNDTLRGEGPDGVRRRSDTARKVNGGQKFAHGVTLDHFYAYLPQHSYIFVPTREIWNADGVNGRLPPVRKMKATTWLDENRPVEQMTWAPGEPMLIRDRLIREGGWFTHYGATCFNLYKPPTIVPGDPNKARPWRDLVHLVYPTEAEHIIAYCAHRVQRPQEKINHAMVFGGAPGIGKDTILEPVKRAVGPWNFQEVSPQQTMGTYNGFLQSVLFRVSEARDLGDADRFQFFDHMKTYTAAPPDVLRVNEK